MSEKIEVFVRQVRSTDYQGHIFFVYTKDDGSQIALSLSPQRGFLGMEGGAAQVNSGAWNESHLDWPKQGEKAATSLGVKTGDI
jgi:hypothetical protein